MEIVFRFLCLSASDWIAIVNIIITSLIGVWIGLIVQKNLTTNRAVKDYFISEVNGINSSYMTFLNRLYKDRLSAKYIQEWLKVMNIRIEVAENSMKSYLKVRPEVLENHISLKKFITSCNEFNSGYKNPNITFEVATKNYMLEMNRSLKNAFVKIVVDINKAKNNRRSS
ncbi:MAG: hypothetical protein ACTHK8_03415 [Ginsengibacter sp.]